MIYVFVVLLAIYIPLNYIANKKQAEHDAKLKEERIARSKALLEEINSISTDATY